MSEALPQGDFSKFDMSTPEGQQAYAQAMVNAVYAQVGLTPGPPAEPKAPVAEPIDHNSVELAVQAMMDDHGYSEVSAYKALHANGVPPETMEKVLATVAERKASAEAEAQRRAEEAFANSPTGAMLAATRAYSEKKEEQRLAEIARHAISHRQGIPIEQLQGLGFSDADVIRQAGLGPEPAGDSFVRDPEKANTTEGIPDDLDRYNPFGWSVGNE